MPESLLGIRLLLSLSLECCRSLNIVLFKTPETSGVKLKVIVGDWVIAAFDESESKSIKFATATNVVVDPKSSTIGVEGPVPVESVGW